jgi:hypothetical protein
MGSKLEDILKKSQKGWFETVHVETQVWTLIFIKFFCIVIKFTKQLQHFNAESW